MGKVTVVISEKAEDKLRDNFKRKGDLSKIIENLILENLKWFVQYVKKKWFIMLFWDFIIVKSIIFIIDKQKKENLNYLIGGILEEMVFKEFYNFFMLPIHMLLTVKMVKAFRQNNIELSLYYLKQLKVLSGGY